MIYDAYLEELEKQEKNKDKQKTFSAKKEEDKLKKNKMVTETQVNHLLCLMVGPPGFSSESRTYCCGKGFFVLCCAFYNPK